MEDLQVLIDGVPVGTFNPSGTRYQSYSTAAFTVTAGAHTIMFQGLDTAGGDNTALVDAVAVMQATPSLVADPGFDQVVVGTGQLPVPAARLALDLHRRRRHLGQLQRLHRGQPAGAAVRAGRLPAGDRRVQPGGHRLGRRLLHAELPGGAAGQPPGVAAGLPGPGRRGGGGHVHAHGHVVPILYHRRVHGHRRAHTITFRGLDSAGGDNTAFVDAVTLTSLATMPAPTKTPTATFLRRDATTQGNWMGTYGAQGVVIAQGPDWLPGDATISPLDESGWGVWNRSTTDPRTLVTTWDTTIGLTRRLAAGWVSSRSFEVDVNLRDGQVHRLELYLLDWDNAGRAEQVKISDARTGAILSTQSVSSFQSGLYLDYAVSGHVRITITNQGGPGVILNGLFLDPDPARRRSRGTPGSRRRRWAPASFQYRPTGSAWTFTGDAGISGNDSGFTAGNPPAPQGTQVAFLQETGSFSQTVAGWAAGTYVLTFDAAQRGNYQASRQDFQVLVDGVGGGHLHALGHVVPGLHHRRVHRRRRVAHDHVPGPGQRRRRQHRLRRRRRADQPAPRSATRASSRCRWAPATSSTARPARPGPSPATPASRATTAASPPATRRRPQGTQVAFLQDDRLVQPDGRRLGRRLLRADLLRRPAGQLPGVAAGLPGAGRRRRWWAPSRPRARRTRPTRPPRSRSRPGRTRSRSRAWTAPAATTPPSSMRSASRRPEPPGGAGDKVLQDGSWLRMIQTLSGVNAPPPKGVGFVVQDSSPVPSEARHEVRPPEAG